MSNTTNSANMNLPVPQVGVESGPDYATDINNCLSLIDSHTHASGSGVLITPSGLDINSDLPLGGNNLTLARSARFQAQVSPIANSGLNVGCLYVSGNELYYNDVTGGHQVALTSSGSVNAGAGSITGLPSGTASVTFASSTYTFLSSSLLPGNLDAGSIVLRNSSGLTYGLTLSPPTLGSNYSLYLPSIPAQTNMVTLDASGNMGTITYDATGQAMTSVGANAIAASMSSTGANAVAATMTATGANAVAATRTRATGTSVAAGGVALSASSGAFSTAATSFTDVTNLSITIVTSGRPVFMGLISDGSTYPTECAVSATTNIAELSFVQASTSISQQRISAINGGYPPSAYWHVAFPTAGTYTFKVQVRQTSSGSTFVSYAKLVAYEL